MNNKSDKELLDMISKGEFEHQAFRVLYDRYSPSIYSYCLKMTNNSEDAGDIFQEVFARFFIAVSKSEVKPYNIKGYLFIIARNKVFDWIKSKKHFFPLDMLNKDIQYDPGFDPELKKIIDCAIDLLDPKYKDIYILKDHLGHSYSEISEMTGLSYNGVKTRYRRALQNIIKYVKPHMVESNEL